MMIDQSITLQLPRPWSGESFHVNKMGPINFLVGPNGSGKSQFAQTLYECLQELDGGARLLSTDRLNAMTGFTDVSQFVGDPFSQGIAKNQFADLKRAGNRGSGIDTIVLLEERLDLRIRIEATLSHLFDREILLEWDSGRLVTKARHRVKGDLYRLDHDECHGIKEIMVLLTHLYDDSRRYLVIDEPELNLHPQYQAFFMQEVRKLAGDPAEDHTKKVFFLVTHSPFILDFRSPEDLKSVFSFDLHYSLPSRLTDLDLETDRVRSFTRRLNANHKQLFFSDNPIFVEGHHDAQLISALMEARGVSVSGAGSCIIDSGGVEETNQYFELCKAYGKKALFVYDLDSLFIGKLRACIRDDETIQSFLATAGVGNNFGAYFGQFERTLKTAIDELEDAAPPQGLQNFLNALGCRANWDHRQWGKARVGVMTAIHLDRDAMKTVLSPSLIEDLEGRRDKILETLREKHIQVLPGGTLEAYLPEFAGDVYRPSDSSKQSAVDDELEWLARDSSDSMLADRYGDLFDVVCRLPSKPDVDVEPILRNHLSDYIHELQRTVVNNPDWGADHVQERLNRARPEFSGVLHLQSFERSGANQFKSKIVIAEMLGQGKRFVQVDENTNAGMQDFEIGSDGGSTSSE